MIMVYFNIAVPCNFSLKLSKMAHISTQDYNVLGLNSKQGSPKYDGLLDAKKGHSVRKGLRIKRN